MARTTEYVDVLRLSWEEIRRILDELDGAEATAAGGTPERREEPRHPYEGHPVILVEVHYPGRDVGTYRAVMRNVSATGIGFLHGKFVYPGSRCRVLMRATNGLILSAEGTATRCEHIEGRVHDVGLDLDEAIDMDEIVLRRADLRERRPSEDAPEAAAMAPGIPAVPAAPTG